MNRIIINEADYTVNYSDYESEIIVYVPGFAVGGTTPVNKPVLCRTLNEFRTYFGSSAAQFSEVQYYPHYIPADDSDPQNPVSATSGFLDIAIPAVSDGDSDPSYDNIIWFSTIAGYTMSDPSYAYASLLLSKGIAIMYERLNDVADTSSQNYDVSVETFYTKMKTILTSSDHPIYDKGKYDITFITTGGYPSMEYEYNDGTMLTKLMVDAATERGDCVALVDHTDNPHRPLEGSDSVLNSTVLPTSTYCSVFTPWCNCTNGTSMSGSYVYLSTLGDASRTNPAWCTVAGVSRGIADVVVSLHTDKDLTNRIAESYQYGFSENSYASINPITHIRPYGYVIWGNRTTNIYSVGEKGFALSFLNIRNIVSYVKKHAYTVSQLCMFETNDDVLWTQFKANMSTLLDQMVTGRDLRNYKLLKRSSNDKTKLKCQIVLYPAYNVESVDITVVLTDEDLSVEE